MTASLPELTLLVDQLRAISEQAGDRDLEERCRRAAETASAARELDSELLRLRDKLAGDVDALHGDLQRELPIVVRDASVSDLRQHFSAFVEHSFQTWLSAELEEFESELGALAERGDALSRESEPPETRPAVVTELGARALEVDSFPRDFGVFALSTVGLAMLFSNLLLGGALLALAPFLARYGRERNEAELRSRAKTEAVRAVREACGRLQEELGRRLDAFAAELAAFTLRASAAAREGALALHERAAPGEDWQQRLSGLLPELRALAPTQPGEQRPS